MFRMDMDSGLCRAIYLFEMFRKINWKAVYEVCMIT
jgi:hypothetical protein